MRQDSCHNRYQEMMELGGDNASYVRYNGTTECFPKSCHFCKKSPASNRRWHQIHIVGKQAEQKQTDRMTHSRLCFSPECDTPPPQAVSLETCWYGREVKRQLNVFASLDKFNGTVVLRGVKYKERFVTSTSTAKGQNYMSLCTSCSFLIHLTCTPGLSKTSSE